MASQCLVDHDEEVVIALAEKGERFVINGSGIAIGLDIAFPRPFDQAGDLSFVSVIRNLGLQPLYQPWTHNELGVRLRKTQHALLGIRQRYAFRSGLADHLFNEEALSFSMRCQHTDSA